MIIQVTSRDYNLHGLVEADSFNNHLLWYTPIMTVPRRSSMISEIVTAWTSFDPIYPLLPLVQNTAAQGTSNQAPASGWTSNMLPWSTPAYCQLCQIWKELYPEPGVAFEIEALFWC